MKISSILILILFSSLNVLACDCEFTSDIKNEIYTSSFIAIGDLQKTSEIYLKFKPVKVYKSNNKEYESYKIAFDKFQDCSYPFNIGTRYLVYGTQSGDSIKTYLCSRTSPIEDTLDQLFLDKEICNETKDFNKTFVKFIDKKLNIIGFREDVNDFSIGSPHLISELGIKGGNNLNFNQIVNIHPALIYLNMYNIEFENRNVSVLLFDLFDIDYSDEEIRKMIE